MHFATLAIAQTSVKHQGGARVQSRSEGRPCTDTYKEEIAARTQRTVTILPDRHHEVLFDLCPGDARHLRHGWEEAVLHPEHLSGGQTAQKKFIIIICSEFNGFFKNQAHHSIYVIFVCF